MRHRLRWILSLVVVALPGLLGAQTQPINGNLVVFGHYNYCAPAGGTDTYACNLGYAPVSYTIGGRYSFKADVANTGAASINFNSLGAKTIKKVQGGITTDLADNDIRVGQLVDLEYDGTNMQMMSPLGNAPSGAPGGSSGQAQYNSASTLGGSTGLTLDATTILTRKDAVTAVSADTTLGAHNIIACTAGATNKTMTLPAASSATTGFYRILKVDTGVGACVVAPNGSDTLNGVNASQAAPTQWSFIDVALVASTSWHTMSGVASPFAPNGQTATYQVLASDFSGYKTITVASGTFTITLVASTAQPAAGQSIRVINYGSGVVTIARSGQNLNGGTASLVLPASSATDPSMAWIVSDGTNYFAALGNATLSGAKVSGAIAGNAGTATALAANGANCAVAGAFPNGVDAAGAAENCVTLSAVNPQTATYQVLAADFDSYKTITVASGTFTITLVASGTQPAAGKYLRILNYGTGVVTIARSGQNLNGGTGTLTLPASSATTPSMAWVISDGTNYFANLTSAATGGGITASSTDTLTNKTLDVEGTGNSVTMVSKVWLPAATCQNATAALNWDTPTAAPPVAACVTGTNTQKGVADFATDSGSLSMQITLLLPSDWSGAIDAKLPWFTSAITNAVVWQLALICVADAETDDPAFNTASTVTSTAKGTANQMNMATITGVTATGCAAGELLHVKVLRDAAHASDTLAAGTTARLYGVELTLRRTQ